jgi:4-coumarate--CoA ligase
MIADGPHGTDCLAVPTDITVWEWLFESAFSPIQRFPASSLNGYHNTVSGEHVSWAQVKEYSTYISTALVKKYGLKRGETISLFSQNSIWYPVVMFGCLRVGKLSHIMLNLKSS